MDIDLLISDYCYFYVMIFSIAVIYKYAENMSKILLVAYLRSKNDFNPRPR